MNRNLKSGLLVGTVVLGITAMIPQEATAQLFRWRGASRHACQPVCCNPTYSHSSHGRFTGSTSNAYYQPSACCEETYGSNSFGSEMNHSQVQYQQESFDAQGNRIDPINPWNSQPQFDSQGNRVDVSSQWENQTLFDSRGNRVSAHQFNGQTLFDAQGNRIDIGSQLNTQQRLDAQGNRIDVGNPLNTQQQLDVQRNRIESDLRNNQDNTLKTNPNPTGVQGAVDAIVPKPLSRD
jgi:hypothetical protein